jgi:hypothetical protein
MITTERIESIWLSEQQLGQERKDPMRAYMALRRLYEGMPGEERPIVESAVVGWLDREDFARRQDALAFISQYGLTQALPKLIDLRRSESEEYDRLKGLEAERTQVSPIRERLIRYDLIIAGLKRSERQDSNHAS